VRLDLAVSRRFGLSRRAAREAVRAGRVDVDAGPADEPGLDVAENVRLDYDPNRPARHRVRTRLSVLFEDDHLVIVDKPAGLLSVPTAEREADTLFSRVLDYLQHRYHRRPYAGVVHRIDKDTSGSIVFARHREALLALQELFRTHDIEREYLAIVEGFPEQSGTLDADLVRDAGLGRRGVARRGEAGRTAVTRYRVLERLRGASLVSVHLETGRTHQIRVHFSAEGHPVAGDRVYRRRPGDAPGIDAPRQMLHAVRLGFRHPVTGARVRVESPIPEDFEKILRKLRAGPAESGGRKNVAFGATERMRRPGATEGMRRSGATERTRRSAPQKNAPPERGVRNRVRGKPRRGR
jgi:23S rRNA pseudouridine1911/1915/1917 synthase